MNILFLSHWLPYPPDNGSKLRIYNLLRGLSEEHRVTLISFNEDARKSPSVELDALCDQVWTISNKSYNPTSLTALRGFLSNKPRVLVDKHVPEMAERIRSEAAQGKFDLVIASQWYMADYVNEFSGIPAIFEEVEVGVFVQKRQASASILRRIRHGLTEYKLSRYLRNLMPRFKACTVVSDIECDHLSNLVPNYKNVYVVPNGVSLEDYDIEVEAPRQHTLIYTGSFRYSVNYEAMLWFVTEVLPMIAHEVPDAHLTITGDHADLPFPDSENVTLAGFVDDVHPLIAACQVSVAPLLVGGGTRLKILEAMALRTPVVATSKGVEGLSANNGEHLLIADSPEEFARAVLSLFKDAELRQKLASNAYQLVRQQYDWKIIMPSFIRLVEGAANK